MKEVKSLNQRMYHLTCMYFMGIQCGIQSYHTGMHYARSHWESPEFQKWLWQDEVVYLLNGLDSNNDPDNPGTMQKAVIELGLNGVPYATFLEPGANNTMTGICFLADESVWDLDKYPDPVVARTGDNEYDAEVKLGILSEWYGPKTAFLRMFIPKWPRGI